MAMWENEISTHIAAPVEDAYRYLAHFTRHKEWSVGVAEMTPVGAGHVGVGSEFAASETVPMKFASHTRVVALEPPRRIAWEATDGRLMRVEWALELSPAGGGTHLVERSRWRPRNALGGAILRLWRTRRIPDENRQSLERLKATLEAGAA
jgi:uncharacterized protein YndB with AHSA1/START domain